MLWKQWLWPWWHSAGNATYTCSLRTDLTWVNLCTIIWKYNYKYTLIVEEIMTVKQQDICTEIMAIGILECIYNCAGKIPQKKLVSLTNCFSNFWSNSNFVFSSWKLSMVDTGNILFIVANSSLLGAFSWLILSSLTMPNTSLSRPFCSSMLDAHFAKARKIVLVSEICK